MSVLKNLQLVIDNTTTNYDIGAEAQDVNVSYNANGEIIEDISSGTVDHTEGLSTTLKNLKGSNACIVDVQSLPTGNNIKNVIYRTPGGVSEDDFTEYSIVYTPEKTLSNYKEELTEKGFGIGTSSGVFSNIPNIIKIKSNESYPNYKALSLEIVYTINIENDTETVEGFSYLLNDEELQHFFNFNNDDTFTFKVAPLYNYYAGNETAHTCTRIIDKDLFDAINNTAVYSGDEEETSEIDNEGACDCVCSTDSYNATKIAFSNNYILREGNRFTILFKESNTSISALTLNINNTGTKPIYINGEISSTTNYTLPAGLYSVLYDGTNYQISTDNTIPGVGSGDFDRYKETIAYLTDEEETGSITDPVVHVSELAQSLSTSTTTAPSVGLVKEEIDDINTAVSDIGDSVSDLETNLGNPSSASSVTGADAFSKISTLNSDLASIASPIYIGDRSDMSGAWKPISAASGTSLLLITFSLEDHVISSTVIHSAFVTNSSAYPMPIYNSSTGLALIYREPSNSIIYAYCDANYSSQTPKITIYRLL
jgi:hypothetical protein